MAVPGNLGVYFSYEDRDKEIITNSSYNQQVNGSSSIAPKKKIFNNYSGAILGIFSLGLVIYFLNGK